MNDSRYSQKKGLFERLLDHAAVKLFRRVNRHIEWHKLPGLLGVANLIAFRIELREKNLHDTDGDLTRPKRGCPFHRGPNAEKLRTVNGTQNDLRYPAMGCRHSRLGRNMVPITPAAAQSTLMEPNPLLVSSELLARKDFKPAESLNLLAAAWIQFQVHDWFNHERYRNPNARLTPDEDAARRVQDKVPDPILVPPVAPEGQSMSLRRTKPDPTNHDPLNSRYPAFRNDDPQWWDGSQIYGETQEEIQALRTDPTLGKLCPHGKLYIDPRGFLPIENPRKDNEDRGSDQIPGAGSGPGAHDGEDPERDQRPAQQAGTTMSGFTDNWWLGLEILHTLFAKEHNLICDELVKHQPQLSDHEIFERARLINCAVMAKIHTIEWTPGILGHPAIKTALNANWMGLLGQWFGEGVARKVAHWLPDGVLKDIFTGVPVSETDHHGAPFALTEEFASVYRLHPLIPEEVVVRSWQDDTAKGTYPMADIAFANARSPFNAGATMEDAIYSFGTTFPGAITIGNYPAFLRNLQLPPDANGYVEKLDLAAVDILRDRERGVPRYNDFREQLRMQRVSSWDEMSGGRPEVAQKLKDIYNDNLDMVDTMVGMFCEPLPKGFGFSDTAFRIFILMASRRLKSDRFFTTDFREEIYTKTGMEWIQNRGMKEVILKHHPQLQSAFSGVDNPFAPWKKAGAK